MLGSKSSNLCLFTSCTLISFQDCYNIPSNKVWLNSKYIKTKQNRKLEAKFFGPFQVLYPVAKQVYKLELSKKWRIHDIFHV